MVFKLLLETRSLIGYQANSDILIGCKHHLESIPLKTFLSEYIVCLIISFSTSQWTKSRMIHTMYMFISSIVKWKMSYYVVHVTNPLYQGYQNKGIVNFVLNF